jgi:hypothetical protein
MTSAQGTVLGPIKYSYSSSKGKLTKIFTHPGGKGVGKFDRWLFQQLESKTKAPDPKQLTENFNISFTQQGTIKTEYSVDTDAVGSFPMGLEFLFRAVLRVYGPHSVVLYKHSLPSLNVTLLKKVNFLCLNYILPYNKDIVMSLWVYFT